MSFKFFATAAKGTEGALRDELRELRFRRVKATRGGVHFEGPATEGYRACLWSRIAMRILVERATFACPSERALYDRVRELDLGDVITPRHTLAVRASSSQSYVSHTQFIAQKTKDAIVDSMREDFGERSSVDIADPDLRLFVHINRDVCTLYFDMSGEPLHLRGWRARGGAAPLKETLAAAIVRLSGWTKDALFLDPMCGSGTLAIEAAALACKRAPGLGRSFGFQRWASYDDEEATAWKHLEEEARDSVVAETLNIVASDTSPDAIAIAEDNARQAGVTISLSARNVTDWLPHDRGGWVVTNPPYGQRLGGSDAAYLALDTWIAKVRGVWTFSILSGSPELDAAFLERKRGARWHALNNGDLDCKLWTIATR